MVDRTFIHRFDMRDAVNRERGFSLLETIIAIMVLTLAMTAVFSLVSHGIRSVSASSNEMVASFLASEGLEYIRNIRDVNVKGGKDALLNKFSDCFSSEGCVVDAYNDTIAACSVECPYLKFDSGLGVYNHATEAGNNVPTIFTRKILMEDVRTVGGKKEEIRVRVIVSWPQFPGAAEKRSIELQTHLFNTKFK